MVKLTVKKKGYVRAKELEKILVTSGPRVALDPDVVEVNYEVPMETISDMEALIVVAGGGRIQAVQENDQTLVDDPMYITPHANGAIRFEPDRRYIVLKLGRKLVAEEDIKAMQDKPA